MTAERDAYNEGGDNMEPLLARTKVELVFGSWYDHVLIDGERIDPSRSQKVWNHSPDGFAWGYGGSGPAQLALAILLHVTDDEALSRRLYQDFKFEFVAEWPQASGTFEVPVREWVAYQRERLKGDYISTDEESAAFMERERIE